MPTKESVDKKFAKLLEEGRRVLNESGWNGSEYQNGHPDDIVYVRFRTEAANLVGRVCGETSRHFRELVKFSEDKETRLSSYYMKDCFAVLEAAHRDFDEGMLFDLRALLSAELLGDMISPAEALLLAGYHIPTASLAGAVLEDTLRKLCETHAIPVAERTKIDTLNADLARAQVYSKLVQKRITALADVRNNADHGKFEAFTADDVRDMVSWIRRFASDELG